jgi:hypothetical protein
MWHLLSLTTLLLLPFICAAVALTMYRRDMGRRWLVHVAAIVVPLQVVQYILAVAYPINLGEVGSIPASIAIFPINLLIVFVIYVKKGLYEFRKFLFRCVLLPNAVLALAVMAIGLYGLEIRCRYHAVASVTGGWIVLVGCVLLLLDTWVLAFVYDILPGLPRVVRTTVPLVVALVVDGVAFAYCLHALTDDYGDRRSLVIKQVVGKTIAGIAYGVVLAVYSRYWERDLFKSRPAAPAGLAFLKRVFTAVSSDPVLPERPIRVKMEVKEADFVDHLDALLDSVQQAEGAVFVLYAFEPNGGKESETDHQVVAVIEKLTSGRFFGECGHVAGTRVLTVHGAEVSRINWLTQHLQRALPSTSVRSTTFPAGPEPALRPSGWQYLATFLSRPDLKVEGYPDSQTRPEDLAEEAFNTIRNQWDRLRAQHDGRWVAFYGRKMLGVASSSYALYERFVTSDRPAQALVIVQIEPELHHYLSGQNHNAVQ